MAKKQVTGVTNDAASTTPVPGAAPAPKAGTPTPTTPAGDRTVASAAPAAPAANPQGSGGGIGQAQVGGSNGSGGYSYTSYSGMTAPELPDVPESQLPENLPGPVEHEEIPDAPDLKPYLDQMYEASQQQAQQQIDYATETGIRDLQRAQEDAQPQFQQMRDQIDINEARSMDNQALYNEARGDRGGIGQAQWTSIQNTAAQNRLQVQQQQTKMATDTARAIADLRAKGEFEKADKMLELTQAHLSQLMQLEQWAASYNMDAAQFRESIKQYDAEYQMQVAKLLEDQRRWQADYDMQRASFLQSQYQWAEQFGWNQYTDQRDFDADQAYRAWQQEVDQRDFDAEQAYRAWQKDFQERGFTADEAYRAWQQMMSEKEFNYGKEQDESKMLSGAGYAMLEAGIMPSESQLAAMGLSKEQAESYMATLKLYQASGGDPYSPDSPYSPYSPPASEPDGPTFLEQFTSDLGGTLRGLITGALGGGGKGGGGKGGGTDSTGGGSDKGASGEVFHIAGKTFTDAKSLEAYLNMHADDLTPGEKQNLARQLIDLGYNDPWGGNYSKPGTSSGSSGSGKPRPFNIPGAK